MVDLHPEIVSALSEILPTHYEMTLSSQKTPCISYMILNDSVHAQGDTIGYSDISYQIKVWGRDISDLQKYASEIDAKLRPMGWKRVSTTELHDPNSSMIQKIMTFEALAFEEF